MGDRASAAIADKLSDLLAQVNDWLKFAEAKNVGIVGLTSGAIAVLTTYVAGDRRLSPAAGLPLAAGGLCLVISLLVGLASFFPQTNIERMVSRRLGKPAATDNLSFYGHLAKYAPRHLAEAVARRYAEVSSPVISELHVDLAEQIVTNARITLFKLRLFTFAVVFFALGVLIAAVGVLVASIV